MSLIRIAGATAFCAALALAGPIYNVTVLPVPTGWTDLRLTGINSSGQVTGYAINPSLGCGIGCQSFIVTTSSFDIIPLVPGYTSNFTTDINDSGQVVGYTLGRGFIATPSGSTLLPLNSTAYLTSSAYGVNNTGAITGNVFDGSFQAYVGDANGFTEIAHSSPWTDSFFAEDINNLGQIVGYGSYNGNAGFFQVYFRDNNGLHLIPLPAGMLFENSRRLRLNDFGQVVGLVRDSQGFSYVFEGDQTGTTVIAPFSGEDTIGPDINNLGQVVDASYIWDSSNGLRDLTNLVGGGWTIETTGGINDKGQIAARASNSSLGVFSVAVLLDPISQVPEPSTLVLFGLGLGAVAVARKLKHRCG